MYTLIFVLPLSGKLKPTAKYEKNWVTTYKSGDGLYLKRFIIYYKYDESWKQIHQINNTNEYYI